MEKQYLCHFGSIFGNKYLTGIGPRIDIKILLVGNVSTELKSEFKSVGINQTIHRLYLDVICNMNVVTPYDNIECEVSNQTLITEAVIVGEIPNTYYDSEEKTENKPTEDRE